MNAPDSTPENEPKTRIETPRLSGGRVWLLTGACIAAAFVLRLSFDSVWTDRLPYAWFFLALIGVARFAGTGPQVATILCGFVLGNWFFVQPRHSLAIQNPMDQVNSAIYVAVSSLVLIFAAQARRAAASRAQLAAIVESSDDAIIGESRHGLISSWNAAAEKLYGYRREEAVGRSFGMLFPMERSQEITPMLQRVRQGERVEHFETKQRTKSGDLVDVSLTISPVRTEEKRIVGVSITARDVSERKRQEREREELIKELQAAMNQVKTLTGLLPICARCKRIRDDHGRWNQIEVYIRDRSQATFTHGICPQCSRQLYPEFTTEDPGSR